ncbi:MAG: efflux RND transporter periplasmic adaptor subunit [Anaerolineae bacterium]
MKRWTSLLLAGTLLFTGCSQLTMTGPEPTPADTESAVPEDTDLEIIGDAVIEPVRWSELHFTGGGTVVEVLAEEGEEVDEGDLLVQLDASEVQLSVQEAEAALALARAQLAQVRAGPRREEIVEAEAQLADARAGLARAEAQRDQHTAGAMEAEVAGAQAELAGAETEQLMALNRHNDAYDEDQKDNDARKQADYELLAANEALAAARTKLAAVQGIGYARLRAAQARVALASAQQDVSEAQLELLRAGVRPEQIAVSEVLVQQAEAALETAKAALKHMEIRAPFAGTVTKINVEVGETATPGDVIVVLASMDQIQVRTTDLTELDVARLSEGQSVVVKVDALPDVSLPGRVARIDLQAVDHHGDVTYPITVELEEAAPELRWGMTAMVEIEVD